MPQTINDDHDLLVRIDEKLGALSEAFLELKESVKAKADTGRVDRLEGRADVTEKRLDGHDKKLAMLAGGLIVFEALARWLFK
jgi:hypothetical protein